MSPQTASTDGVTSQASLSNENGIVFDSSTVPGNLHTSSATLVGSSLISPFSNTVALPPDVNHQSPFEQDGSSSISYHPNQNYVVESISDPIGFLGSTVQSFQDHIPRSGLSPSLPTGVTPPSIEFELATYTTDEIHPGLPPLTFQNAPSQVSLPGSTTSQLWDPGNLTAQLLAQKPATPSGPQRGFSYTYGSGPGSGRDSHQPLAINHLDQFMWDEKFLKSLEVRTLLCVWMFFFCCLCFWNIIQIEKHESHFWHLRILIVCHSTFHIC